MGRKLDLEFDSSLIDAISADFDLRAPNKEALRTLIYTLNGDYDPEVTQVMNLATGVGKTYLMAALIEYLRRQGIHNVVIVTPGKVVQAKTVQNFTQGSPRYIAGSAVPPEIVTPQDYSAWIARSNGSAQLSYGRDVPMLAFIFNIQQLIAPSSNDGDTRGGTQQAQRRRPRKFDENAGILFDYLKELDDLVVIADESHLYSVSATAFHGAIEELDPAACIGLTASVLPDDHVIYRYPLYQAIKDQYVKAPVLAFRKGGYGDDEASEEQQLSDAVQLREIKQRAYDAYAESVGTHHLNAVLFVVCADTDHADQVTALLRSPRFFGKELSVLQVDNNHDDAMTQQLLDDLDRPDSPVLAVVSVNKLKEGWDVKNIAVVVTLRAMASEVLTQQTMGRGLRLPFGRYTGVLQIDQLDIISHQSFRELLDAENVLQQFGLEDAAENQDDVNNQIKASVERASAETSEDNEDDSALKAFSPDLFFGNSSSIDFSSGQVESFPDASTGGSPLFDDRGLSSLIKDEEERQKTLVSVRVKRNPKFEDVAYRFPRTTICLEDKTVDLSDIDEADIKKAAERVTSTGEILVRKELIAVLGKRLSAIDTESAEVDSIALDDDEVALGLLRTVMNDQLVPVNETNKNMARGYVVKKFMRYAPIEHWTVKAFASADQEIRSLVKTFVDEVRRNRIERTKIDPIVLPSVAELRVPLGDVVHSQIEDRRQFKRGRFYGGWFKSLYEAESFDSYTGEYLLAKLLNTSPNIVWWQRLHTAFGAYIYYSAKDKYYPDFIAKDDDGVLWIIEGKEQRGKADQTVQKKRLAAERVVHRLVGEHDFADQSWGYLIAYEDDIKTSDSWNDLKAKTNPVSNA